MAASFGGHMEVVEVLLRAKADIEGVNSAGENALMAAACGGHVRVAQYLHNSKADIHAVSRDGWDVLMFAAHAGNFETIKVFPLFPLAAHKCPSPCLMPPRPGLHGADPALTIAATRHSGGHDRGHLRQGNRLRGIHRGLE